MTAVIDLMGKQFGRLTVYGRSEKSRPTGALWDCSCECGGVAVVDSLKLRSGHTRSCGCLKVESRPNLQHGKANSGRTYRSWKEMRQRCNNPNSTQWKWYGGRGIKICPEWDNYMTFLSDMGERPEGKTIDRIDSDGDYTKENCKWSTAKEQAITNRGCFKPREKKGAA